MGVELYIAGFHHGEPSGLTATDALEVFGLTEADQKGGFYALSYDNQNRCDISVRVQKRDLTDICIHRPCGHDRLYSAIFYLLSKGPYVAFTPNGPLVAARPEIEKHLPGDIQEAFGRPVTVTSASALKTKLFE